MSDLGPREGGSKEGAHLPSSGGGGNWIDDRRGPSVCYIICKNSSETEAHFFQGVFCCSLLPPKETKKDVEK